jgi:hypothetical protein
MEIPEQLSCLFTAQVDRRGGSYVIEIPDREVELGALSESGTYRVVLSPAHTRTTREPQSQPREQSPEEATEAEPTAKASHHD